jgi:catechol 2,3-dioxygenase-like lactoylglutathione lyase family enzyme
MFDHVGIRVPNLAGAQAVLDRLLTPLGIDQTANTPTVAVWHDFVLAQADKERPVTRGAHLAFVAPSRDRVDNFWRAGIDAGLRDDGPPGLRPRYSNDYYGAFLRDLAGNSLEAVHRDAHRVGGAIDHVWIRVADFEAATAFYRTVAAAAGFDVRSAHSERTTFAGGASGGSFSLVPGPPTENLHMAFPGDEEAVRRFYDSAIAAGYRGNGEPGERPRYHPGYYASFVLDPDGNNIELVDHHRT